MYYIVCTIWSSTLQQQTHSSRVDAVSTSLRAFISLLFLFCSNLYVYFSLSRAHFACSHGKGISSFSLVFFLYFFMMCVCIHIMCMCAMWTIFICIMCVSLIWSSILSVYSYILSFRISFIVVRAYPTTMCKIEEFSKGLRLALSTLTSLQRNVNMPNNHTKYFLYLCEMRAIAPERHTPLRPRLSPCPFSRAILSPSLSLFQYMVFQ